MIVKLWAFLKPNVMQVRAGLGDLKCGKNLMRGTSMIVSLLMDSLEPKGVGPQTSRSVSSADPRTHAFSGESVTT